jgi:predicted DNA-binding antitoxin AbrB/MazE fold protein
MSTTVEAIYENGVLRLSWPIDLADGTPVEVIIIPRSTQPRPQPQSQSQPRKRTPAEILAEIAAIAVESTDTNGLSGRDHDKILYGDQGAR